MILPQIVAEEIAALEKEIADIAAEATRKSAVAKDRLAIIQRIVDAFVATETPVAPQKQAVVGYNYDALVNVLRAAPAEGLPLSALPIDHPARLSVLLKKKIAHKLPSGNWAMVLAKSP